MHLEKSQSSFDDERGSFFGNQPTNYRSTLKKGMSKVRSSARGDLYAHAYIHTPKKLTKKQRELLEELDKELGEVDANYKDEGFFSRMKNMWS